MAFCAPSSEVATSLEAAPWSSSLPRFSMSVAVALRQVCSWQGGLPADDPDAYGQHFADDTRTAAGPARRLRCSPARQLFSSVAARRTPPTCGRSVPSPPARRRSLAGSWLAGAYCNSVGR